MSQKLIFIPLLTLFTLISCVGVRKQDQPVVNTNTPAKIMTGSRADSRVASSGSIQTQKAINNAILKTLKPEERVLFTKLESIQKNKDIFQQGEVLAKIQKLEETKRKELDALVKSGDTKKAQELRKTMMIFSGIR